MSDFTTVQNNPDFTKGESEALLSEQAPKDDHAVSPHHALCVIASAVSVFAIPCAFLYLASRGGESEPVSPFQAQDGNGNGVDANGVDERPEPEFEEIANGIRQEFRDFAMSPEFAGVSTVNIKDVTSFPAPVMDNRNVWVAVKDHIEVLLEKRDEVALEWTFKSKSFDAHPGARSQGIKHNLVELLCPTHEQLTKESHPIWNRVWLGADVLRLHNSLKQHWMRQPTESRTGLTTTAGFVFSRAGYVRPYVRFADSATGKPVEAASVRADTYGVDAEGAEDGLEPILMSDVASLALQPLPKGASKALRRTMVPKVLTAKAVVSRRTWK